MRKAGECVDALCVRVCVYYRVRKCVLDESVVVHWLVDSCWISLCGKEAAPGCGNELDRVCGRKDILSECKDVVFVYICMCLSAGLSV